MLLEHTQLQNTDIDCGIKKTKLSQAVLYIFQNPFDTHFGSR